MSLNNSIITQSIGVPYQQYVTSSAGHTLVSSSTYFNDTSDNIPRYKDANGVIYDAIVSSSYSATSSFISPTFISSSAAASGFGSGGGSIPAGTVSGSAQISELGFVTSSATASFSTKDEMKIFTWFNAMS